MKQDDLCSFDPDVDYEEDNSLDEMAPSWSDNPHCEHCGDYALDFQIEDGKLYCEQCCKELGIQNTELDEEDPISK